MNFNFGYLNWSAKHLVAHFWACLWFESQLSIFNS